MQTQELRRLITALETENKDHYHGNFNDGLLDALKELENIRSVMDSVDFTAPTIEELADAYESAENVRTEILGSNDIIKVIQAAKNELECSQTELAAKSGVGKTTIDNWLYRGGQPSLSNLLAVLETLNLTLVVK